MSIAPASAAASLHVELPSALSLGQIVKARVLKHYEGSRYLMSLEGREHVVDSSVPLKTGDLIRGRVVAVGDRIELQPLPESALTQETGDAQPAGPTDELTATFARFGLKLDDAARGTLERSLRGASDPQAVVLSAMTLAKLGLPLQPELIDAARQLLHRRPAASAAAEAPPEAVALTPGPHLAAQLQEVLRTTRSGGDGGSGTQAEAMPAQVSSGGAHDGRPAGQDADGSGAGSRRELGHWVMNTQTGGAVAHRVGTLPLLLGGRLVEVDVALFEQDARQSRQGESRSRHLVFVLDAGTLGGVEVSARLVDARLRVRFAAERAETLELLAGRREELGRRLAELGWTVDEIVYESRAEAAQNAAYRAVADHVVTQGSLDRRV